MWHKKDVSFPVNDEWASPWGVKEVWRLKVHGQVFDAEMNARNISAISKGLVESRSIPDLKFQTGGTRSCVGGQIWANLTSCKIASGSRDNLDPGAVS
jgi:hypothetical protein